MDNNRAPSIGHALVGLLYLVVLLGAWLYASTLDLPTEPLWIIAPLVLGIVLVGQPLSSIASNAKAAATQTNGALDQRIKAAAAAALADRDAARTRQAYGDVGAIVPPPGEPGAEARRLEPPADVRPLRQ